MPWYDENRRKLPWRAEPGANLNPYHIWLSEVMLQQTTVPTVIPYFKRFIEKWPTLTQLAQASLEDIYYEWQGLGYYSRAKNLHKCSQVLNEKFDRCLPATEEDLLTLPGIGPYTAAAIAAIAFEQPTLPVDGNIIRVLSRLNSFTTPLPLLKDKIQEDIKNHVPPYRRGDMAQSLMDLGSLICQPRQPKCSICPLLSQCKGAAEGIAASLPLRLRKPEKPTRYGLIYWYETTQHQILICQRPEKGVLANLMEIPSTPWIASFPALQEAFNNSPLKKADGSLLPLEVSHTFTHFHLKLKVLKTVVEEPLTCDSLKNAQCVYIKELERYAFPTLMKKVVHAVLQYFNNAQAELKL